MSDIISVLIAPWLLFHCLAIFQRPLFASENGFSNIYHVCVSSLAMAFFTCCGSNSGKCLSGYTHCLVVLLLPAELVRLGSNLSKFLACAGL